MKNKKKRGTYYGFVVKSVRIKKVAEQQFMALNSYVADQIALTEKSPA